MNWFRRYWAETLTFGAIFGCLIMALSPGMTWMATDSDGPHYIFAAKYLTTAHHLSAPLYLLLGHLFLKIPIGADAWRMGLMSVFGTMGSVIFIYLILRHLLRDNPKARLYAIISCLVFGGSALIISQSIIVETMTLAMMCGLGAYYFTIKKKWLWASVMLGAGLAIHPFLAFIAWAVLFIANKEMRYWERYMVTIFFFAFYSYIPLVGMFGSEVDMWATSTAEGFFGGTLGMVFMHTGGISVWDLPKRVLDTLLILMVSFGLGIVPLIYYFVKQKRWRGALLWLVLIPVIYFAIDLANQTYVYMVVAVAFGSIAVGLGLSRMKKQWAIAVLGVAIILMGYNAFYFDIGKNLDPEMSAMKFYNEELPKIPDGEYFMGGGWTWAMVYVYNKEEGRNIIPISYDALPSDKYLEILHEMGIKFDAFNLPLDSDTGDVAKQRKLSLSISKLNEGVWIAKETKPEVYQYVIEPVRGNEDYLSRWWALETEPELRWKPSNPYKFISGQLEVSEWHHLLWVRNPTGLGQMLFIIIFGIYGYGVYFFLMRMWKKKHKVKQERGNEVDRT